MPAIDPPSREAPARFDDVAIARLDELLMQGCYQHNGLSLETVDGLFSCAFVSPGEPLTFAELLPLIMGERLGKAPAELLDLLDLMWQATAARIENGAEWGGAAGLPLIGVPALLDEPDAWDEAELINFPLGSAWALGFMLAYCLREEAWDQRLNRDADLAFAIADIFSLISALYDENPDTGDEAHALLERMETAMPGVQYLDDIDGQLADDDGHDEEPLDFEDRLDIIRLLPDVLLQLHRVTLEEHLPDDSSDSGSGAADLCPCGSGKRFKRCHGDPARLN